MTGTRFEPEYASPNERLMNYCLAEYEAVGQSAGMLRSSNLLFQTFENNTDSVKQFHLVKLIRSAFGDSNSVWGVKWDGKEIRREYYFYDYRRRFRERSISLFLEAISSMADCSIPINENLHYFMFSIDIDQRLFADSAKLNEIHMYMGNVLSRGGSGICYSLTESGKRLENFYFFLDAHKEIESIILKICSSAVVDVDRHNVGIILWPELVNCRIICIANKQQNDCIYFSGITVHQLLFFLKRFKYPPEIITYIESNKAQLDYMLYDVGFDFRMEEGELVIVKSGYYGIF